MLGFARAKMVWAIGVAALVGLTAGFILVAGTVDHEPTVPPIAEPVPGGDGIAHTTASTPGREVAAGVVPDVRAKHLPAAEQVLAAAGFLSVQETDASVKARTILVKDNWVVVDQSPPPGGTTALNTIIVLKLKKPTDDHEPVPTASGVVPDVVCSELQAAQEALRSARFFLITAKDGTGQDRLALVDRDWVVIAQSVRPGTSPGLTTHVELTVVKYGEPAGASGCAT